MSGCIRCTDQCQGISLSIEQYNALLAAAPLLETVLSKKNIKVARPDYKADSSAAEAAEDEKERKQQSDAEVVDDDEDEE